MEQHGDLEDQALRPATAPDGGLMAAGYRQQPVVLAGRPRSPVIPGVVLAAVVAVLVVKPWGSSTPPPTDGLPVRPEPPPPAVVVPARPIAPSPAPVIGSLASRSGSWGIGGAGVGSRYDGEPRVDWVAVEPLPVLGDPHVAPVAPDGDGCAGRPVLPDGPLFLAVTNPRDLPVDRRLTAWLWGGTQVSPLADVLRVTPLGDRGISYLVRDDRAPWPAGRYEFHVITDDLAVALTVCLGAAD